MGSGYGDRNWQKWAEIVCLLLFVLCISHHLFAQADIPIGTWRTHFSYQQASHLQLAEEKVYCAAQNGLFYYEKSDNSLNVLTKSDGLSDVGIADMSYQEEGDLLLLAYKSNLIDVLSAGQIGRFGLLNESERTEQINDVLLRNNLAYVATNLGVRVLEIDNENDITINIRESYTRLSIIGDPLPVYDISIARDSIYLATAEGVISNALAVNVNRQDFASWKRYGPDEGLPLVSIRYIEQNGENVYAAVDNEGVYTLKNGQWILSDLLVNNAFSSLRATSQSVAAVAGDQIYVVTDELAVFNTPQPAEAVVDAEGVVWVADEERGLIRINSSGQQEILLPEGPLGDDIYSIHYAGEKIFSLLNSPEAAFSTFQADQWNNYDPARIEAYIDQSSVASLIDVDYLPAGQSYYFASAGSGLIRWDGNEAFDVISSQTGESTLANDNISSVLVENNNLWVTNYNVTPSLHLYDVEESNWQAFAPVSVESRFPVEMVLTVNDMPWLLSSQQGVKALSGANIIAYDVQEDESLSIRSVIDRASLPGDLFTDIVEDREGQIWLAGNEGVAYFPAPRDIFAFPNAVKPIFENQFLFFGDAVTSLAVDGGNRKWMGSRDGIWLFSETAEELIAHFTTANSPLPSDNILDITINDNSGEVFILTDKGLISYRGTSTEGKETHATVKIFPNPVPADFTGYVGIEGLVTDANIKITTITGTLVKELMAEGGTAVWDIKDYNGSRVGTGVYLVFSASADGSQTFVGKVAVIN
ncbi:type IX secretion system anionic LPS delivery protein PorZ [Catalinimonas niigatensis]|uniref:type IX secretion system anionic LPS delivery protein PorZ n=1 Tax=Catalinimonas niigatensis TaxID=1397264 RepID=UPI002665A0A8|nr:two-component regulator propeller domain-containing protein [Catalinimonas niigatensis]WPP53339.1 two-component regulator propeller domain-containing protein [Catalinimonas niigatensis]